ncbi:DUF1415 domain-containing protein [Flavilitoribacter nigricans]|uniref:DUF1415 domain-containing protein n=1 Tax=Flavilitoribacter nigricans (strain ATCC 23147 / DSM 23189 / NBRC 102662 / NCIMB 1420 / SS-2) TaxID=1122177 RepID=A0A2D0NDI5_FLAN2|nr:DUF1415 domain-containing protein [Flavilitoribacter nigricans]PHN06468.1 hypothetical protein CRP01_12940 [Flavilitoribacter nigricans DSM 23189 = NBRC 102662]
MEYLKKTREWVRNFVIALNLCPFAAVPFRKDQIRIVLEESRDPEELADTLLRELDHLLRTDPKAVETTLIVHPNVLTDFLDYNDFLGVAEDILEEAGLNGILQLASFHPDYQFAGTPHDDPANYTNRSPFPMLHLLREESISKAVDNFPDPDRIPEVNVERLRTMTIAQIRQCWTKQEQ